MTAQEKRLFEAQAEQLAAVQAALDEQQAEREERTEERIGAIGSLAFHIIAGAAAWYYLFWHLAEVAPGVTMDEYYGAVGSLSDAQRGEYIAGYVLLILGSMGLSYLVQKIRSLF